MCVCARTHVKTYFDQILPLSFLLSCLTKFLFLPIFFKTAGYFRSVCVYVYETYYTEFGLPTRAWVICLSGNQCTSGFITE